MASSITAPTLATTAVERPLWSTVYAMGLCSFALIASEFLPVSLLSPIAADLHLTEGQAGQAISISGVFALLTSLSVIALAGCLDRKHVLLGLTTLLMVSGVLVALAPSYAALMAGRALLGFAIGGFWSMLAANAMRLVPANTVITAFAVINGGNAIASTVAAPLGSFVGGVIGWRGTFFCVVPVAATALLWQALSLPSLPAPERRSDGTGGMLELLREVCYPCADCKSHCEDRRKRRAGPAAEAAAVRSAMEVRDPASQSLPAYGEIAADAASGLVKHAGKSYGRSGASAFRLTAARAETGSRPTPDDALTCRAPTTDADPPPFRHSLPRAPLPQPRHGPGPAVSH